MGVAGCGKSTLGARLAQDLGWAFRDGDDLHPAPNIAKMAAGVPLDDADRAPWLAAIGRWIDERIAATEDGVVTCSALRCAYRERLASGRPEVRIVHLTGTRALIAARLAARAGHFMPASLNDSQFDTLEAPEPDEGVLEIPADQALDLQVARVIEALVAPSGAKL